MPNLIRRIVSGPKARHVDKALNVDLDLVYVTDRLIIMGWPAANLEAIYRNNRKSVRRFLDAKHGEKYRVYNLCPCSENSYDANDFYGAVSRYPFPDHHPPPLSMIAMFVCDVTAWLAHDPENAAVIHCKAGKGRSGTMTCCYLLSLPVLPSPPSEETRKVTEKDTKTSSEEAGVDDTTQAANDDDVAAVDIPPRRSSIAGARPVRSLAEAAALIERSRLSLDGVDPVLMGNVLAEHAAVKSEMDEQPAIAVDSRGTKLTSPDRATGESSKSVHQDAQQAAAVAAAVGDVQRAYTVEALAERMYAVFELHTARRLKPLASGDQYKLSPAKQDKSLLDSGRNSRNEKLPFLQEDPAEQMHSATTSHTRAVSPHGKGLERSRSVSDLLRKASSGLLRNPGRSKAKADLTMTRNEVSSGGNGGTDAEDDSLSSSPSSPPRNSMSRSGAASRANLHALGVNPMGRSTTDLTATQSPRRPSMMAEQGTRPYGGAVAQGSVSTSNILRVRATTSSPGDTRLTVSTDDGLMDDHFKVSARASRSSPPSQRLLAPPLYQPGQAVPLSNISDRCLSAPYAAHMASTSQLSLGLGGNNRFSAEAKHIDDILADGDDEDNGLGDGTADDEDIEGKAPRLAVSIPSQRRMVGYFARVLAGLDPREPLVCPTGKTPRRTIRITRILVDRRTTGDPTKGGSLTVQLGRYDPDLERRLHAWELSARRRTRAFGFVDPSAPTPDLPDSELTEHGTDFRGPQRRQQEKEAEEKRWRHVAEQNARAGYERKMAQHGNDRGVGCWGINVLAEVERVRNFAWSSTSKDVVDIGSAASAVDKQAQKEASKHETEIDYFATIKESDRRIVRTGARSQASASHVAVPDGAKSASSSANGMVVRHIYALERDGGVQTGVPALPTWLKSAWTSRPSVDTMTGSPAKGKAMTSSGQMPSSQGGGHASNDVSSNDSSPSQSFMWGQASGIDGGQAIAPGEQIPSTRATTPPTSIESATRQSGEQHFAEEKRAEAPVTSEIETQQELGARGGLIVDADHALQIKLLSGRSGASHGRLPDMASCGFIWFIPSFETPTGSCVQGERIRRTFTAAEVDFRKGKRVGKLLGGEIRRVTIEWEWIETGSAGWDDETEDYDCADATSVRL